MLTRLQIQGFRLLADVSIDFEPGKAIVLIGPNGSGKSTVLEALDFLATAVSEGLNAAVNRDRYGYQAIANPASEDGIWFRMHLKVGDEVVRYRFQLLPVAPPNGFVVADEWLQREEPAGGLRLINRVGPASARVVEEAGRAIEQVDVEPLSLVVGSIRQPARYPTLAAVRELISTIRVYPGFSTLPNWAKDRREAAPSPRESAIVAPIGRLDKRGLDLVNVLYTIQNHDRPAWNELLGHFRAEFPFVDEISFPADPGGGRVGIAWRDRRFGGQLRAFQMSDGMIAFLCLLAALHSVEPPSAVGFDEPESNLHPSALRRLVSLTERASDRMPVIIATHSDALLDHLSDPAASVIVCEPGEAGTTLHRLDPEALSAWRQRYSMSELRSGGQLDPANVDAVEP